MKDFLPYKISHIYLNEQVDLSIPEQNNHGNYLVFWWKEIPLGELFIEPNKLVTREEYLDKVFAAIHPTLLFYSKNTDQKNEDLKKHIFQASFSDFKKSLQLVFVSYEAIDIPRKVPVSVIICTRNRSAHLYKCLSLLRQVTCRPEEVIVVDNAPDNDSTEKVVQQFEEAVYIKEPRKGLDIARNTGIAKSKCPVLAFTDDDVVVHHLWVYRIWEAFQNESVAAMTGLVIASELQTEAQFIFEKHWSFNRGYVDKVYDASFFKGTLEKGPPVWEIGAGANMAFRRSVFTETGTFHELLDVGAAGCNGDSEMWYRILAKGRNIVYSPRAVAFHEHRKEIKGLKKQIFFYMRGYTAAALLQQKQHPDSGYKRHIFYEFPKYYATLLKRGFPRYRYRYSTVINEIKGVISGLAFYHKHRNRKIH
jgi:glycosyltransferase involved in cell wall biosynthesis